jgi:heme exporter protein D
MSAFFSQGGYAFYVWSSYGMALILLALELVQLRSRRRTILARLGRLMRMRSSTRGGSRAAGNMK